MSHSFSPTAGAGWPLWKREWTVFVAAVLLLRGIYAGIGWWVVASGGPIALDEPIYEVVQPFLHTNSFSRYFVNPWFGWDTISYLGIAILGYRPDASIAFMPLYPFLIRVAAPVFGGNHLLAALVLSTLLCVLLLIMMYELFAADGEELVARDATMMYLMFPTAFFLLAGYTESLFLVLVLAVWIAARSQRWGWAAIFACLATLTRLQGVVLSAVLLWILLTRLIERPAAWQVRRVMASLRASRGRLLQEIPASGWAAVLSAPLTAAAYQLWLGAAGYDTIAGTLQTYWRLETVLPWTGVALFLQRLPTAQFHYMDWIDLFLFVVILIASILGLRRLDPAYSLYVWLTLAVLFTRGTPPHLLASYSRYFLALFPLVLLPAQLARGARRLPIMIISFALQIVLVSIFLWGSWVA